MKASAIKPIISYDDLEKIDMRPFDQVSDLSEQDIELNEDVVKNVRLWDYRPLQATYEQLQALRPYYQFSAVDIDRYEIDGEVRQVMLAGRELNKANLPAPSWVNRNLEFTHGYGIVMNPVDSITQDGQPEFFIQDLPPQSSIDLQIERPEIYYGELTNEAVFVSSGPKIWRTELIRTRTSEATATRQYGPMYTSKRRARRES